MAKHKSVRGELEGAERRQFTHAILRDLEALEALIANDAFERGVSRIGAEQELFLVDRAYRPAPGALKMLDHLRDSHFTTELGLFNLEINADHQSLSGSGLHLLEEQLKGLYRRASAAARDLEMHTVLAGILPTIDKHDLGRDNMVPNPRYKLLSGAMDNARCLPYDFSIRGADELLLRHDSVMVEACNASFQVHLQIAEPSQFTHAYNIAQLVLAPVLAVGTNSPLLFGRRLWAETRIPLFEQACDARPPTFQLREATARVFFGRGWLEGSITNIYRENIAHFRALVGTDLHEDSLDTIASGGIPELRALRHHGGTIYRWNRPCYGISESGKPHLRIELRALPAGPTIADEVANAAFWLGLMTELTHTLSDVPSQMSFDDAARNFYAAARDGLDARFTWLHGKSVLAKDLLLGTLLPLSRAGLSRAGVDAADADRYAAILSKRIEDGSTGSAWSVRSYGGMPSAAPEGERARALVAGMIARQDVDNVAADWKPATLTEACGDSDAVPSVVAVYARTRFIAVLPDDSLGQARTLLGWEGLTHLAIEDRKGHFVGLVARDLLDQRLAEGMSPDEPVSSILAGAPVILHPVAPLTDAIELFQKHAIDCLPVVQDAQLIGMLFRKDAEAALATTAPAR